MPFTLTGADLSRLCQRNLFDIPLDGMIFFGIRGCLPVQPDDQDFKLEQELRLTELDYTRVRCTLGQWLPAERKLAVFPGSTVPFITNVQKAKLGKGIGANQLMTGYYPSYERKKHMPKTKVNWHDAFGLKEGALSAIRRSEDDTDFDAKDRVEVSNPHDNIHAAYSLNPEGNYSSSGCQVVLGFPQCDSKRFSPEGGPWKAFKSNAYGITNQGTFPYVLLDAREVNLLAEDRLQPLQARARFGSSGNTVKRLQAALAVAQTGGFDEKTLRAMLKFQAKEFGVIEATGVVGQRTAEKLGIKWPTFTA